MVGAIDTEFPPERVKLIRVLQGLSQEEFGKKYGIAGNTVSRLERHEGDPLALRGKVLGALLTAAAESKA